MLHKKCLTVMMLMPAAVVIIIVLLLRPIILIRFGYLPSLRIGPYAGEPEQYLCERDADISTQRTLDIFFNNSVIANYQLKKMWDRILNVSRLAKFPYILAKLVPGMKAHLVPQYTERDIRGLITSTPPHLSFTTAEERFGEEWLRKTGISDREQYICFFSRDSAYLNTALKGTDWSYHNYRDSSIHDHVPAMEELTRRGYYGIRVGSVVKEPLKTTNPMIIDYATKHRTDFLDIYLGAKCRFSIGDSSGVLAIPTVFRRPLAFVNFCNLEQMTVWGAGYLLIPKKLWLRNEDRFMTFREIFNSDLARITNGHEYERLGIDLIDNTPEEITDLAVEMDDRLNGIWESNEDDENLQRRFWSHFKSFREINSIPKGVLLTRIGTKFLRQNRALLE